MMCYVHTTETCFCYAMLFLCQDGIFATVNFQFHLRDLYSTIPDYLFRSTPNSLPTQSLLQKTSLGYKRTVFKSSWYRVLQQREPIPDGRDCNRTQKSAA